MSVSDKNVNFRASEETMSEIADIQKLFQPFLADRSSTLRWIIRTVWMLLFTDAKVIDAFKEWQLFSRDNAQREVAQLNFEFPRTATGCEFFPRVGSHPWFSHGGKS